MAAMGRSGGRRTPSEIDALYTASQRGKLRWGGLALVVLVFGLELVVMFAK